MNTRYRLGSTDRAASAGEIRRWLSDPAFAQFVADHGVIVRESDDGNLNLSGARYGDFAKLKQAFDEWRAGYWGTMYPPVTLLGEDVDAGGVSYNSEPLTFSLNGQDYIRVGPLGAMSPPIGAQYQLDASEAPAYDTALGWGLNMKVAARMPKESTFMSILPFAVALFLVALPVAAAISAGATAASAAGAEAAAAAASGSGTATIGGAELAALVESGTVGAEGAFLESAALQGASVTYSTVTGAPLVATLPSGVTVAFDAAAPFFDAAGNVMNATQAFPTQTGLPRLPSLPGGISPGQAVSAGSTLVRALTSPTPQPGTTTQPRTIAPTYYPSYSVPGAQSFAPGGTFTPGFESGAGGSFGDELAEDIADVWNDPAKRNWLLLALAVAGGVYIARRRKHA